MDNLTAIESDMFAKSSWKPNQSGKSTVNIILTFARWKLSN